MNQVTKYVSKATNEVAEFLDHVAANKEADSASILDSVKNTPSVKLPESLEKLIGLAGEGDEARILDSVTRGVAEFTAAHGTAPTADLVEAALQQGHAAFLGIDQSGALLDSVVSNSLTSNHHENLSLQSNRAVVAVLSAMAEAIPFAAYLPVDIGSNQSKLAILSHQAGTGYGDYAEGAIMDGINVGDNFASSSRMIKFDLALPEPLTGKFSVRNLASTPGFCDPAADGLPVLRGRTVIYVNGLVAAREGQSSGATAPISGSINLEGVEYVVAGTVNPTTGAVTGVSFTPDLPAGSVATAQGFVDYEKAPALIPSVIVKAETFDLYANPWRVMTGLSIDAAGQLKNELGLDANSEALMAIRTQMAMERHYQALAMVAALGQNLFKSFDFEWDTRNQQMNRSQIWQDLQAKFSLVDQIMAIKTMDHGITHMYVGQFLAGILQSLPRDMFESSGITARPSIYRVGRLFGKYEVYYSPKVVQEATDLSWVDIIAVGRSSQVARCPVVLGDAIAPTFLPLNMQTDLRQQSAMYARDFTQVNPHQPSALGCARIRLTNIG